MPSDRPDINKRYIKIEDFTLGIHSTYWSATSQRTTFKKNGAATIENTYQCVANPDGVLGPLPRVVTEQTLRSPNTGSYPARLFTGAGLTLQGKYVFITDLIVTGPVYSFTGTPLLGSAAPNLLQMGAFATVAYAFTTSETTHAAPDVTTSQYVLARRYFLRSSVAVTLPDSAVAQDIYLDRFTALTGSPLVLFDARPGLVLGEGRSAFSAAHPPPPAPGTQVGSKIIFSLSGFGGTWGLGGAQNPALGTLDAADQAAFDNFFLKASTFYSLTNDDNVDTLTKASGALSVYPGSDGIGLFDDTNAVRTVYFTGSVTTARFLRGATSYLDYVSHQGRVCGFTLTPPIVVPNVITKRANVTVAQFGDTTLCYTNFPDYIVHAVSTPEEFPVIFHANPENTSGYGAIGSINASQLLLIKHSYGGVLIQGDLDNPTVTQLPYLESTQGSISHGVNTPLGFVYGSRNGVFIWAGGETSEKLSAQIDGRFWDIWTDDTVNHNIQTFDYGNHHGISARFSYWAPWVVVPNNYFFDTRTNSWWRYSLPESAGTSGATNLPIAFADVDPLSGDLFVAPYAARLSEGQIAIILSRLNNTVFATSYSWQSQPLLETELVLDEYDELVLIAQRQNTTGTATITVTLTGFNEDGSALTPAVTTFVLAANTQIQMIRKLLSVDGSGLPFVGKGLQYRIEVSNTASAAAALVHDIWLGISTQHGEHPLVSS